MRLPTTNYACETFQVATRYLSQASRPAVYSVIDLGDPTGTGAAPAEMDKKLPLGCQRKCAKYAINSDLMDDLRLTYDDQRRPCLLLAGRRFFPSLKATPDNVEVRPQIRSYSIYLI